MKLNYLVCFLFICLLTTSCKQDDLNSSDLIDLELTDQFTASIFESFDNTGKRSIWLQLETLEEFTCNNYQLDVEYSIVERDIFIDIKGLFRANQVPCEEGVNNATAKLELGQLDISSYNIKVKLLNELEENGTLDNTTEHIDLNFQADGWMQIPNSRMIKVVGNTIWGYFLSEAGYFDHLAAQFIDELEGYGAPLESDGYFGAFSVRQGQVKVITNEHNTTTLYTGFGMKYFGEPEVLQDWILEHYCDIASNIGLHSTKGDLTPCE